jgi:hypothetical protein
MDGTRGLAGPHMAQTEAWGINGLGDFAVSGDSGDSHNEAWGIILARRDFPGLFADKSDLSALFALLALPRDENIP